MTLDHCKSQSTARSASSLSNRNSYLLLALASLCWSGNHIVGRAIVGYIPPFTISTVRWLIPVLVLWLVARTRIRKDWPLIRQHWHIVLWLGVTGGALFSALQYVGLQYTSALNASILNSLVPVLILATGTVVFRDRIVFMQVVGIGISLMGVLIIITKGNLDILRRLNFNYGDIIIFINMVIFAIYASYLRQRPQIHWLSFIFVLAVVSVAGTTPFAILEVMSGYSVELNILTVLAIVYVSIFPGIIAFAAWNRGVEIIGANRSGPFLHLIPVYTAILAGIFLGEYFMLFHIFGLMLILGGVWFAARPQGV
jgi:drug/metabolite transporter (DMT)-like permease